MRDNFGLMDLEGNFCPAEESPRHLHQKILIFFSHFLFVSRFFSESCCIDDLSFAYVYGDQEDDDGIYDGLLLAAVVIMSATIV